MKVRQTGFCIAFGLGTFLLTPTSSCAQTPYNRPPYSPYLNLTRPGGLTNNYYGLVRPQNDFRNSIDNLQQRFTNFTNNPMPQDSQFPSTGHPATFMNYSHYFGYRGGPAGASGLGAAARRR